VGETVRLSTGRLDPEELPTMTNASWRLVNWLSEYAELMLMLRSEAGKVYCAMAQMFELYLLHVFYTFSSLNLADVILPQQQQQVGCVALFSPKTSILIQKRHPHTGNLNSETPGDSKNTFLHCRDVLALQACRPAVCLPSTLACSPLTQLSISCISRHHPACIHRRKGDPQSTEACSCYK